MGRGVDAGSNGVGIREPEAFVDVSDIGGEGGVGDVTPVLPDFVERLRGVAGTISEMTDALSSDSGDWYPGRLYFEVMESACCNFSCVISCSILRSESSSLNLCTSILSASRSASPAFISASSITALSIETLYFVSKSSRDDLTIRS